MTESAFFVNLICYSNLLLLQDQFLSLFLRHGKVHLVIRYGRGASLIFETTQTYNNGAWIKVEAARALRNGLETGVLRYFYFYL